MHRKTNSKAGTIAVIAFFAIAAFYLFTQGPEPGQFESLKEPRISSMPHQNMLVVTAKGDPNVVAGTAFKLLFRTYYRLPGASKGSKPAPRARWSGDMNDKSSWTGFYALPVPAGAVSLPQVQTEPGYKVELVAWEYGDVAEILHVGPYAREKPTIERLHRFILQQGYEIIGPHEEEYVKGPGMFFTGDPEKYRTIVRYRVKKAA
jgi:hypothetical protein